MKDVVIESLYGVSLVMIDLPKLSKAYLPCGFNSVLHRVVNGRNHSFFCYDQIVHFCNFIVVSTIVS